MMSMTLKRVLAAASTIGLAIIALSVVTGTLVETRGPGADRLPQVSVASPLDAGAVIAEVGSPTAPSVPSVAPTVAPTTTVTIVVVASGAAHRSSPTDGDSTRSIASVGVSSSAPSRPSVITQTKPPTIAPSVTSRVVPTATTVPKSGESAKTKTEPHSTTIPSSTTTTVTHEDEHVVVTPTVREDHEGDH